MSKKILSIVFPSGILGFYRGTQHYSYNCRKDLKEYNKQLEEYNIKVEEYKKSNRNYDYTFRYEKPYYFYSLSSLYGLFGTVMYVNPFTTPFMVIKEVYRLEINMRGELDELKNKDEYYRVLL